MTYFTRISLIHRVILCRLDLEYEQNLPNDDDEDDDDDDDDEAAKNA
jgi:hypothetical protein